MTNNTVNENRTIINTNPMATALANLVPADEQAVDVCEDKEITLAVVNPYAGALSTEDLEVESEDIKGKLAEADKKGFFSPVIGMARLTNILGGMYFAQICIDGQGNRRIEICQEYETGGFSPKITIKQSDFLRAANYSFGEANIPQRRLKNLVENFIIKLSDECMNKFDWTMSFDVVKILQAIAKCYRDLPVYNDLNDEDTPATFYHRIMEVIRAHHSEDNEDILCGHKAYYPLDGGDIKFIATELDMTQKEFLKKLKKFNFLYLTESSAGYQTNVRITIDGYTHTEHRYCILRLKYLASIM